MCDSEHFKNTFKEPAISLIDWIEQIKMKQLKKCNNVYL